MRTPEYWKKDLWVRILPPVRGQNQTQDSREGSTNAANVLSRGPYCRWTRVRNAIAWRKTQNEKFRKFFSLGPPTTRKMYILRRFWVDQVLRRRKKYDFACRRWTCRRTQYIRINLGRKTGFASTQKAFGSTQKVFGQRKRFLVNAKAFWVNANSFWTSVRTKYLYHKFVYIFVYF